MGMATVRQGGDHGEGEGEGERTPYFVQTYLHSDGAANLCGKQQHVQKGRPRTFNE